MVEIDPEAHLTVYDYADLKDYIASLFDGPVDVVNRDGLKLTSVPPRRRTLSMPSDKSVRAALLDIQHHIELAVHFVAGLDRESFKQDVRTLYAVTRCLEIIPEASRRIPDGLKARHPSIDWKQMAGAGNIYRHDYEDVAADVVWDTVERALPPLRVAIEAELRRGT